MPIPGGSVTEGFALGQLRQARTVGALDVMRRPVTLGQYRACERAGACRAPLASCLTTGMTVVQGPTDPAAGSELEAVPITCVGSQQAEAYCAWVGGRLPVLAEWLLAARGPELRRHPWGNEPASCTQHPMAQQPGPFGPVPCANEIPGPSAFEVGQWTDGASPEGMEDVLLAPGELLARGPADGFGGCAHAEHGCVVYGLAPGAIDSVGPIHVDEAGAESSPVPYGFRCVWAEEEAP